MNETTNSDILEDAENEELNPADFIIEEDQIDERDDDSFSLRQKLAIGVIVLLSTLLFTAIFFPYEAVIRYFLQNNTRSYRVDFSKLDLNLFSVDRIQNLSIHTPDNSSIKTEVLTSNLSYMKLWQDQIDGLIQASRIEIDAAGMDAKISKLNVNLNIKSFQQKLQAWSGNLEVSTGKIQFNSLPDKLSSLPIPLPFQPDELKVSRMVIKVLFDKKSRLNLNGTQIYSNFFNINVNGNLVYTGAGNISRLELKVCLSENKNLEKNNKELSDMFKMLTGGQSKQACYDISGSPGSPDFRPLSK